MKSNQITFEPVGDDLYNVIYPGRLSRLGEEPTTDELTQIIAREPYNFAARMELADRLLEAGDVDAACEVRFEGCVIALESLPDEDSDEDVEIAWDNSEGNRNFVSIIAVSAGDHYMFGDFEMAAVMFETALLLDSEDHLDVTPAMLCSFAALGEWEAYDLYKINLAPKSLGSQLVTAFADFRRLEGAAQADAIASARSAMPDMVAELLLEDHPQDERIMDDMYSKRPSRAAQARALWFDHTPIWSAFPEFVEAMTR